MPRVICTRVNASELISGVRFYPMESGEGMLSEEITDEQSALFLAIDGYTLKRDEANTSVDDDPVQRKAVRKPAAG